MPSNTRHSMVNRSFLLDFTDFNNFSYQNYINSLHPVFWLRLNETSGTIPINRGSLGSSANGTWTPGSGAIAQTGQLGVNQAYTWDGGNSLITIPALAGYNNLTTFTWAILCKPASAGEGNAGHLFSTDLGTTRCFRINSSSLNLNFFNTATGGGNVAATSVTTNGFISTSVWQYVFVTFDNSGDRKARIYKYTGGVLTEATYTQQDAMVGTISLPSSTLIIGNRAAQTFTFNGLIDEAFISSKVLSSLQMRRIGERSKLS